MKSIFEYLDYVPYLEDKLQGLQSEGRGNRGLLAKKVGCQPSYVSRVMKGNAHFSFEQADLINRFFQHSKEESKFFLLLVSYGRSGTASLKKSYKEEIDAIRAHRLRIKNRLDYSITISPENQAIYYSSWIYAAIHVALTIPELRTVEALARELKLDLSRIRRAIEFLVSAGLATQEKDQYVPGTVRVHLGDDSRLLENHHRNWKLKSIEHFPNRTPKDLMYSAVASLSREDRAKLRELFLKMIEEFNTILRPSKEEEICLFSLDFFKIQA